MSLLPLPKQVADKKVGPEDCRIVSEETVFNIRHQRYRRRELRISGSVEGWAATEGRRVNYFNDAPDFVFAPSDGATLRLSERYRYDWPRQLRVATLRYEVITNGAIVQAVERPWLLHWYSQEEFRRLLCNAGLQTAVVLGENGRSVDEDAPTFIFVARRPSAPA